MKRICENFHKRGGSQSLKEVDIRSGDLNCGESKKERAWLEAGQNLAKEKKSGGDFYLWLEEGEKIIKGIEKIQDKLRRLRGRLSEGGGNWGRDQPLGV